MRYNFTFLVLFLSLLNATNSAIIFNPNELISIKKTHGKIAYNRIVDYQKMINNLKNMPKKRQLRHVNAYLNQLLSEYDAYTQNSEEYWATPKEFLSFGYGDCEDYAIIKYYSLIELGFDPKRLFFTVVEERATNRGHMVLSYYEKHGAIPLVLDNLSFRILPLNIRTDLRPKLLFNTNGVFEISSDGRYLLKKGEKLKQFEELLIKIKRGK